MPEKTVERGYGAAHKALRRRVALTVEAGRAYCWRCGRSIPPGSVWHLGHSDSDRRFYMGPEHARCSLASGGRISGGRHNGASRDDDDLRPERTSRVW